MNARKRAAGKLAAERPQNLAQQSAESVDPFETVASVLILALVTVRWLVPTESAPQGDTLWIVQLWFGAAVVWAWSRVRSGDWRVRLNLFDGALWLLVAGHLASTATVFISGGDRRAALNMAWEWLGLGTTFFLLRQIVPPPQAPEMPAAGVAGRQLAMLVVTLGVVLAGLGIWQHYVYYPRAYEEYRGIQSELDKLRQTPRENARRIAELELKLEGQGVPSEAAGRQQFENRLHFSNEPFGPFALANTFAGFLLVAVILAGELFRAARRTLTKTGGIAWGAVFLLLVYCLVLTKSRTAWIALAVAFAFQCVLAIVRAGLRLSRRAILLGAAVAAGAAGILGVLLTVAAWGGGFDVQVISEAPKSLDYRLQYWTGAMGVIREHPLLGVGPGNFRQHYLRYKVPESSEDIADPHNLFLDLWTSGGLLALAGFFGCAVAAVAPFFRRGPAEGPAPPATQGFGPAAGRTVMTGAACGFLLAVIAPLLSPPGDFDFWQLVLFAGWVASAEVLRRYAVASPLAGGAVAGAALGLFVHLLGAGGIEMPAVVQLFLLIAVAAFVAAPGRTETRASRAVVAAAGAAGIVLFVGCLLTATLPVLNRRALVAAGEQSIMLDGDPGAAILNFSAAAVRDPLSPDPPEKLAEAFFSKWRMGRTGASATAASGDFAKAEQSLGIAIRLDPYNSRLYRRLGAMELARFVRSGDLRDAAAACDALAKAAERYPNDSSLCAQYATALSDAGRTAAARKEAEQAIHLDEINRQCGHTDRYLPDATLLALRRLAVPGTP